MTWRIRPGDIIITPCDERFVIESIDHHMGDVAALLLPKGNLGRTFDLCELKPRGRLWKVFKPMKLRAYRLRLRKDDIIKCENDYYVIEDFPLGLDIITHSLFDTRQLKSFKDLPLKQAGMVWRPFHPHKRNTT